MARDKKDKIGTTGDISLGGSEGCSLSIGTLLGRKTPPKEKTPPDAPPQAPHGDTASLAALQQATLHRESSGRGGRTVVLVSFKPPLSAQAAEEVARKMRKGLGCGAHVVNGKVVLQGDIQDRAIQWLERQGVKKTVKGN